jgi:hypothetical protein
MTEFLFICHCVHSMHTGMSQLVIFWNVSRFSGDTPFAFTFTAIGLLSATVTATESRVHSQLLPDLHRQGYVIINKEVHI